MQRQRSVWLMLQRAVHSQPLIFVRAYARMQHLVPRSTLIKQHEQLEQQAHVIEHEPQPQATAPQTPSPAAPAAAPITPTTTTTTTTSQPQQQQQQQPIEKRRVVVSVPIEHQRFLRVGVVGPANAGKSSLVNSLVRSKISASSHKSQTTRTEVSGFLVEGNVQIEFVDTPGFVRAHALKKPDVDHTMAQVPWNVIETANTRLVLAVVDVDRFSHEMSLTRSGINTFRMLADLYKFHQALYHQSETLGKPMEQKYVLLVNKTDLIAPDVREKRTTELLDFAFETYPNMFSSAFAISSRDGTMIPELREFLVKSAPLGPWVTTPDVVSPASVIERIEEVVREQLYRRINQEIPYLVEIRTPFVKLLDDGTLRAIVNLVVRKRTHPKILIGAEGRTVRQMTENAIETLQELLGRPVKLSISVVLEEARR